ncbi:MAG: hypothetical protein JW384_03220 [Nitrosomonadaceae bacterium]|nr:hypothetical protein [Nitrosomonadaceae bacterium]
MNPKPSRMGTGSTWKSPNFERDGKLIMIVPQGFPTQPQSIYFTESTDLMHRTVGGMVSGRSRGRTAIPKPETRRQFGFG